MLEVLARSAEGKGAVGAHTKCLARCVRLCKSNSEEIEIQIKALNLLGGLLVAPALWPTVVKAGAIGAAVAMLKREDVTEASASKAVGMLYCLLMCGYVASLRDTPGCLELLTRAMDGRFGAAAADTAKLAMVELTKKLVKTAEQMKDEERREGGEAAPAPVVEVE